MASNIRFTFCSTGRSSQDKPGDTNEDLEIFQSSIGHGLVEYYKGTPTTSKDSLKSAIRSLPQSNNCVFYFTGYGTCDDKGQVYIALCKDVHVNIKDIIEWFPETIQRCQMYFEICLPSTCVHVPTLILLPSRKNFLVAISGINKKEDCRVDFNGGKWTKYLSETYTKMKDKNCPMAVILGIVALKCEKGKPLFTSSGQAVSSSCHPSDSSSSNHQSSNQSSSNTSCRPSSGNPNSSHKPPTSSSSQSSFVSSHTPSSSKIKPIPSKVSSDSSILDTTPTSKQLKDALKRLNDDQKNTIMWKDRFAARILKKLGKKKDILSMITCLDYFIDYLDDEKCIPTWRIIIHELEEPTKIKANNVVISDEVKQFIGLQ